MKRVKRFGVLQTSIVSGIILAVFSLIIVIPFALFSGFTRGGVFPGFPFGGGLMLILFPVLYGVMGFIMTAISCFIYNLIAQWTGGIEVEIEDVENNIEQTN